MRKGTAAAVLEGGRRARLGMRGNPLCRQKGNFEVKDAEEGDETREMNTQRLAPEEMEELDEWKEDGKREEEGEMGRRRRGGED